MARMIDLTNMRFGRLTVVGFSHLDKNHAANWKCRCECGNFKTVLGATLRNGKCQSCGCLSREVHRNVFETHGKTGSSEYQSWVAMKSRCYQPNAVGYKYYGGRGIKVCERWLNSFEAFLEDMGERPQGCTLDRIDVNGNYEPSNCRWATDVEQANNTRKNRFLTYAGMTMTIKNWSRFTGINKSTIWSRLEAGFPLEIALFTERINPTKHKELLQKHHRLLVA